MGSLILQNEQNLFVKLQECRRVIEPMVLQIHNTIVLQRAERDGKVRAVHFWVFGSLASLMGKHGFAEKLHSE